MNRTTDLPICKRHGTTIYDTFPRDCCLAAPDPLTAVLELRNRAFAMYDPAKPAWARRFCTHDTCEACVAENLATSAVQELREVAPRAVATGTDGTYDKPRTTTTTVHIPQLNGVELIA